jgi:hypothetical protein
MPVAVPDPCVAPQGPIQPICVCAGKEPTRPGSYFGETIYTGCEEVSL